MIGLYMAYQCHVQHGFPAPRVPGSSRVDAVGGQKSPPNFIENENTGTASGPENISATTTRASFQESTESIPSTTTPTTVESKPILIMRNQRSVNDVSDLEANRPMLERRVAFTNKSPLPAFLVRRENNPVLGPTTPTLKRSSLRRANSLHQRPTLPRVNGGRLGADFNASSSLNPFPSYLRTLTPPPTLPKPAWSMPVKNSERGTIINYKLSEDALATVLDRMVAQLNYGQVYENKREFT